MHAGHQSILKEARALGTHLLVGVLSDSLLTRMFDWPAFEDFGARTNRVLQNRHVVAFIGGGESLIDQ